MSPRALALALLPLLAYARVLGNGYIWDDDDYVTENVTLRTLSGRWMNPMSGGLAPRWTMELKMARLVCPLLSMVPTRLALLNPLRELMRLVRWRFSSWSIWERRIFFMLWWWRCRC